ncbi:MAG: hypothetical protein AAF668_04340 [Pseudomonadota bacterium]
MISFHLPRILPIIIVLFLGGCTELTIDWAALDPKGEPAFPPINTENQDKTAWKEDTTPRFQDLFQSNVFGHLPDASTTEVLDRRRVADDAFNGLAHYDEITVRVTPSFSTDTNLTAVANGEDDNAAEFMIALITPKERPSSPVIIMETFCARWNAAPHPNATTPEGAEQSGGFFGVIATYVFGRYICTPPFEEILSRGYAVAVVSPQSVVPDQSRAGLAALRRLSKDMPKQNARWGAIAAWGWTYSRAVDALLEEPTIDPDGIIVWGHSRYGKAALVAAAFDPRIDAVIAHQSGTGGASLNWDKPGESIDGITKSYPHWFADAYKDLADASEGKGPRPDFDQHMLLALIAPRPILLGNARRDVWSDPNGAFRAAIGATPAYTLLGKKGLSAKRLNEFVPSDDIAFWLRPGTHGVVKEDWPAFLSFLDAHIGAFSSTMDARGE